MSHDPNKNAGRLEMRTGLPAGPCVCSARLQVILKLIAEVIKHLVYDLVIQLKELPP
jgi:hypothetical protein